MSNRRTSSMAKDAQQPENTALRERLWASRQANYENLDKAVLSLSSGALVLSMAFFKDVVPLEQVVQIKLLFVSWILLGLTISANLISFWVSQKAHDVRLDEIDGPKITVNDSYSLWTERLNRLGIILFLAAIGCSIVFVIVNVSEAQRRKMLDIRSNGLFSQPSDTPKAAHSPKIPEPDDAKHGIVPPEPLTRPPTQTPASPQPSQQPTGRTQ